jgi:hypothetical protein
MDRLSVTASGGLVLAACRKAAAGSSWLTGARQCFQRHLAPMLHFPRRKLLQTSCTRVDGARAGLPEGTLPQVFAVGGGPGGGVGCGTGVPGTRSCPHGHTDPLRQEPCLRKWKHAFLSRSSCEFGHVSGLEHPPLPRLKWSPHGMPLRRSVCGRTFGVVGRPPPPVLLGLRVCL